MPIEAHVCKNIADEAKLSTEIAQTESEQPVETVESYIIELNQIVSGKTFAEIIQEINDKTGEFGLEQVQNVETLDKYLFKSYSTHFVFEMIAFWYRDFKDCNYVALSIEKLRICLAHLEELTQRESAKGRSPHLILTGLKKLQQAKIGLQNYTSNINARATELTQLYNRFHDQSFDDASTEEFESQYQELHEHIKEMQMKLRI